jgi:hypothetical protein
MTYRWNRLGWESSNLASESKEKLEGVSSEPDLVVFLSPVINYQSEHGGVEESDDFSYSSKVPASRLVVLKRWHWAG